VQLAHFVFRYKFQHFFEPLKRVYIIFFAGSKKGIKHGSPLCSALASGKQVVFCPKLWKAFHKIGYAQKKIMQSNIYYLFYNQWNHNAKFSNCFA